MNAAPPTGGAGHSPAPVTLVLPPSLLRRGPARLSLSDPALRWPGVCPRGVVIRNGRRLLIRVTPQRPDPSAQPPVVYVTTEEGLVLTVPACPVWAGSAFEYHAEVRATLGSRPLPRRTAVCVAVHSPTHEPFRLSVPVLIIPSWWLIVCWAIPAVFGLLVWSRYTETVRQTGDAWAALWEMAINWRFFVGVGSLTLVAGLFARALGFGWLVGGSHQDE